MVNPSVRITFHVEAKEEIKEELPALYHDAFVSPSLSFIHVQFSSIMPLTHLAIPLLYQMRVYSSSRFYLHLMVYKRKFYSDQQWL